MILIWCIIVCTLSKAEWDTPVKISQSEYPLEYTASYLDPSNGHLHICYYAYNGKEFLFYIRYSDKKATNAVKLSEVPVDNAFLNPIKITGAGDGKSLYLVYAYSEVEGDPANFYFMESKDNGDTWSAPVRPYINSEIYSQTADYALPCVVRASTGRIHLFFFKRSGNHKFIHMMRSPGSIIWGKAQVINTTPYRWFKDDIKAVLNYKENKNEYDIYVYVTVHINSVDLAPLLIISTNKGVNWIMYTKHETVSIGSLHKDISPVYNNRTVFVSSFNPIYMQSREASLYFFDKKMGWRTLLSIPSPQYSVISNLALCHFDSLPYRKKDNLFFLFSAITYDQTSPEAQMWRFPLESTHESKIFPLPNFGTKTSIHTFHCYKNSLIAMGNNGFHEIMLQQYNFQPDHSSF